MRNGQRGRTAREEERPKRKNGKERPAGEVNRRGQQVRL
jgi:hypothetical protein